MNSSNSNKYGLSRNIPQPIAREIRQRCGFGCVKCGFAVYQYEHIDPLFSEAKSHESDKIVLLCAQCHDMVTRGLLSKHTIKLHAQTPFSKKTNFSFGPFDVGNSEPIVKIGTLCCIGVESIITIEGKNVFSILPPEAPNGPFRINAIITNDDGTEIINILNNEWKTPSSNWDTEVKGNRIIIRKKKGDISLQLRTDPPNILVVERLKMSYMGTNISCNDGKHLQITTFAGNHLVTKSLNFYNSKSAISIINGVLNFDQTGNMVVGEAEINGNSYFNCAVINGRRPPDRRPLISNEYGRNKKCNCGSEYKRKHCCENLFIKNSFELILFCKYI